MSQEGKQAPKSFRGIPTMQTALGPGCRRPEGPQSAWEARASPGLKAGQNNPRPNLVPLLLSRVKKSRGTKVMRVGEGLAQG